MKKFLYSPGFGAGWSTWASYGTEDALFDQKIIGFLESGGEFTRDNSNYEIRQESEDKVVFDFTNTHPVLAEFVQRMYDKYGECFYIGGASDLRVGSVTDDEQIKITEYDGSEGYQLRSNDDGWY